MKGNITLNLCTLTHCLVSNIYYFLIGFMNCLVKFECENILKVNIFLYFQLLLKISFGFRYYTSIPFLFMPINVIFLLKRLLFEDFLLTTIIFHHP